MYQRDIGRSIFSEEELVRRVDLVVLHGELANHIGDRKRTESTQGNVSETVKRGRPIAEPSPPFPVNQTW